MATCVKCVKIKKVSHLNNYQAQNDQNSTCKFCMLTFGIHCSIRKNVSTKYEIINRLPS